MAEDEFTTDLPEQRHWTRPTRDDPRLTRCERIHYDARIGAMTDRAYWNARARGMAGVFTSGAAEDLLGLRSSRYWGETIFVHEFSHNILIAAERADPALHADVARAVSRVAGRRAGKDEYASTSLAEYWAEGSQFWFYFEPPRRVRRRAHPVTPRPEAVRSRALRRTGPRLRAKSTGCRAIRFTIIRHAYRRDRSRRTPPRFAERLTRARRVATLAVRAGGGACEILVRRDGSSGKRSGARPDLSAPGAHRSAAADLRARVARRSPAGGRRRRPARARPARALEPGLDSTAAWPRR